MFVEMLLHACSTCSGMVDQKMDFKAFVMRQAKLEKRRKNFYILYTVSSVNLTQTQFLPFHLNR